MPSHTCCDTLLSLFIPPLGYFCKMKKLDSNFLISLLLMIFTLDILAPIFVFYTYGMDVCIAILSFFLPPLGVLFGNGGCCETLICLVLTCLGFLPGVIYAFHINMQSVSSY